MCICAVNWNHSWSCWLFPFIKDQDFSEWAFGIRRGLPGKTVRSHNSSSKAQASSLDRFSSIVIYWCLTSNICQWVSVGLLLFFYLSKSRAHHRNLRNGKKVDWNTAPYCFCVNVWFYLLDISAGRVFQSTTVSASGSFPWGQHSVTSTRTRLSKLDTQILLPQLKYIAPLRLWCSRVVNVPTGL